MNTAPFGLAQLSPEILSGLGGLLPGLLLALILVVIFFVGLRLGKRSAPRSVRQIVTALQKLGRGDLELSLESEPGDANGEIVDAVTDLASGLRDRRHRLEKRAARLGEALESVPGRALLIVSSDLVVRVAGEGVARFIGGRPEDFEDKPVAALFTSESWAALLPKIVDRQRRETGFHGRLDLLRAAKPALAVRASIQQHPQPDEGFLLYLEEDQTAGDGISAQQQLEQLRGVLDSLTDGILVLSGGRIVGTNPAIESWLGRELVGTDFKDLVPAEDLLLALDRVERAALGERVDPFRCWLVPANSKAKPRRVQVFARAFVHEGQTAAVLTVRDRVDDRATRQRSRDLHARLRAVLENVADGFVFLSPPLLGESFWRVSLTNSRTSELLMLAQPLPLGATEEDLRNRIAHRFGVPRALAAFLDEAAHAPGQEHNDLFDLAGSPARSVEIIVRPVRGVGESLLGRVIVVRDITRHRETERRLTSDAEEMGRAREALQRSYEDLAEINRDLEHKSHELDGMNKELVGLDAARKQLLANVSHELQTPLVSIRGYTQMVLEGRLGKINDEQRTGLEVAMRNIDRMNKMIHDQLSLARSEEKSPVALEVVDPSAALEEVFERHREIAQQRKVILEHGVEGERLRIQAEREAFVQVLDNLVGNAVKFNQPGGRVEVTLREGPPGFVALDVMDTGIGIPADEQERVFDRFYRGSTAGEIEGTGIGLATVRNLVNRHKGHIELSSTPDHGTTIRVLWPRASASSSSEVLHPTS